MHPTPLFELLGLMLLVMQPRVDSYDSGSYELRTKVRLGGTSKGMYRGLRGDF